MSAGAHESPELVALFNAYTGDPDSLGRHLADAAARSMSGTPLLVATATDLALYPGGGAVPEVLGFRYRKRAFKELAGISHLGPALASLVALKDLEPEGVWQRDGQRLAERIGAARAVNSAALWRDVIAVEAYRGREDAIAAMVDHTLQLTGGYLARALADPRRLSYETLRVEVLEDGVPAVSLNRVMIATFYLVGMETAHRLIRWVDGHELDWEQTMVVVAGQQGRPTAGVTWRTNSVAGMIRAASRGRLPLRNLYIAPHAPTFESPEDGDLGSVRDIEPVLRTLSAGTREIVGLAAAMFPGYPAFSPDEADSVLGDSATVTDMPQIRGPQDWFTMVTRLRLVMEDPRQLLSGAVADYAAAQLAAAGNDPGRITVPGLDAEPYPGLTGRRPRPEAD